LTLARNGRGREPDREDGEQDDRDRVDIAESDRAARLKTSPPPKFVSCFGMTPESTSDFIWTPNDW